MFLTLSISLNLDEVVCFKLLSKAIIYLTFFAGNPLSSATVTGNLDKINLLLEKGARPNSHKTSPLVVASYNGNKICCEKLIEVESNVNEMTIERLRPFVGNNLDESARYKALLRLQSGADVNCSYKNLTALHHAVGQTIPTRSNFSYVTNLTSTIAAKIWATRLYTMLAKLTM
ncbi:hypothetical protein MTP99_005552 [Tenebrio molitor]|nr:hypothetical protein MTP99_005552 [Tenebrio molitor]